MTVEFDPERLDRGRRRIEPALIGTIVVALAIGAAIVKPWESAPTTPQPEQSQAAVATTTPGPTPSTSPEAPETPPGPDWTALTDAVTKHDEWGLTTVLRHGPGAAGPAPTPAPIYTERWTPIATDTSGAETAVVDRGGADVAALAITAPDAVKVRAVRWWELHESNELEWVDAAGIDGAGIEARLLARAPVRDGASLLPWGAGQYRADVLTDDGIHRISVAIAKQFGDIPRRDDWPSASADTVPATASDPSAIHVGMFATVDGRAVSIPARESQPLSNAAAWRQLAVDTDPAVAAMYLPRATGLGVMLTSHAAVDTATIERLAPDPLPNAPSATGGISNSQGRTPFVMFQAPGGIWTPGVYAVSVEWKDAAGPHHGAWHVELRPGPG